jgi:T5orf172 domain
MMGDLSDQFSRLGMSDHRSPSASYSPAPSCPLAASQQRHVNDMVKKKIRLQLVQSDLIQGTVYVAKETCSPYTKIGWTTFDRETRWKEISSACKMKFSKIYQTPPFLCAFRAEQIIQSLVQGSVHQRVGCKCRTEHHEWHMTDFHRLIAQTTIVYTWLAQEPYNMSTRELKPEWVQALNIWCECLKSTVPPDWDDFFLGGLSLRSPSSQVPLTPESCKSSSTRTTASASGSPKPRLRTKRNGSRARSQRISQSDSSLAITQPNSVFDDEDLPDCATSTPSSLPTSQLDTPPPKITYDVQPEASPASTLGCSGSPIHFPLPKLEKSTEPVVTGEASAGDELAEESGVLEDPAQMSETEPTAEDYFTADEGLLEASRNQTIARMSESEPTAEDYFTADEGSLEECRSQNIAQCHVSTAPSQPQLHLHDLDRPSPTSAAPACIDGVRSARAKTSACVYAMCFLFMICMLPICAACAACLACGFAPLP